MRDEKNYDYQNCLLITAKYSSPVGAIAVTENTKENVNKLGRHKYVLQCV